MDETQILCGIFFGRKTASPMCRFRRSGSGGIGGFVLNTYSKKAMKARGGQTVFSSERNVQDCGRGPHRKSVKVEAPYGKPVDAEDVRVLARAKKIRSCGFATGRPRPAL